MTITQINVEYIGHNNLSDKEIFLKSDFGAGVIKPSVEENCLEILHGEMTPMSEYKYSVIQGWPLDRVVTWEVYHDDE